MQKYQEIQLLGLLLPGMPEPRVPRVQLHPLPFCICQPGQRLRDVCLMACEIKEQ